MIEISVTGLQKSFDLEKKILDGLTFQINSGERVGLLGKNGAGKTTLFRILTGEIDYDAGEVAIASDRRVGLISQIPVYPAGYTVEDVPQSAFERMRRMADEMERLSAQMAKGDESEETLRRYGELSARFEGLGGYDTATAVNKVANGLSIPADMRTRLFDTLSGGEKTRVNLGRLILEDTDILLLDEPTNHLDLHAIEWLEEYLASFKGTVAPSRTTYFLDRTITRVIEILDGHASSTTATTASTPWRRSAAIWRKCGSMRRSRPRSGSSRPQRTSCTCGRSWATTRCTSARFRWKSASSGCARRTSPRARRR